MELDHGMSTAKCIWLLYKIAHVIPSKQRSQILEEILSHKRFYSYFFSWSYNIRMVFYYFYYFQLYQMLSVNKESDDNLNPIRTVASDSKFFFGVSKSEKRQKDQDAFQKLEEVDSSQRTFNMSSSSNNTLQLAKKKDRKNSLVIDD